MIKYKEFHNKQINEAILSGYENMPDLGNKIKGMVADIDFEDLLTVYYDTGAKTNSHISYWNNGKDMRRSEKRQYLLNMGFKEKTKYYEFKGKMKSSIRFVKGDVPDL